MVLFESWQFLSVKLVTFGIFSWHHDAPVEVTGE